MYAVIEKFPTISFLLDEEGNVAIYDDIADAIHAKNTGCQDGVVVNLNKSES